MTTFPWFSVLDWRYCSTFYWLFVRLWTDGPCWLVMRYSLWPTLTKHEFPLDRGHWHDFYSPRYREEWRGVNQIEPAYSLEHTFHLELGPMRQHLYLLFHSPSRRPRRQSQMGVFTVDLAPEPWYTTLDHEEWTI